MLPFCTVLKRFVPPRVFLHYSVLFQREIAPTDNEDSAIEKQSEEELRTLIAVLNNTSI